jgi:hypothetical protein
MLKPVNLEHYAQLGLQYVVVRPEHSIVSRTPVFANKRYLVYRVVLAEPPQPEDLGKADI